MGIGAFLNELESARSKTSTQLKVKNKYKFRIPFLKYFGSVLMSCLIIMLVGPVHSEESEPLQIDKTGLITVEPSPKVISCTQKDLLLVPYKERRPLAWTKTYGLSASWSDNQEFSSNYLNASYEDIYGGDENTGIELHVEIRRNYSWASLGYEFDASNASKKGDKELIGSKLNLTTLKLGAVIAFDNLFANSPYIVPYFAGGAYQILYKETLGNLSNKGNTMVSFYGTAGLAFALGWMDPNSAAVAYYESGILNTFLFVEATTFMASSDEKDPDFSGMTMNAGIKVEL